MNVYVMDEDEDYRDRLAACLALTQRDMAVQSRDPALGLPAGAAGTVRGAAPAADGPAGVFLNDRMAGPQSRCCVLCGEEQAAAWLGRGIPLLALSADPGCRAPEGRDPFRLSFYRYGGVREIARHIRLLCGLPAAIPWERMEKNSRLCCFFGGDRMAAEQLCRSVASSLAAEEGDLSLFLSLDPWIREGPEEGGGMEDLLYFLFADGDKNRQLLQPSAFAAEEGEGMEAIPSMPGRNPLRELSPKELEMLLLKILEWRRYDYLLVTVPAEPSSACLFFLERAHCIFTLTRAGEEERDREVMARFFRQRYGEGFCRRFLPLDPDLLREDWEGGVTSVAARIRTFL